MWHSITTPRLRNLPFLFATPPNQEFDWPQTFPLFDKEKEDNRRFRRRYFSDEDWKKHRSAARYVRNILNIPKSRFASAIVVPVIWVGGVSFSVGCYETALMDGWLPSFFPTMTVPDPSIASIASFAMSLLLAYRTSSSYRRWEEARSLFGALINRSRDLHRQYLIFSSENDKRIVRWIAALCYSLMWTLRTGEHQLSDLLSDVLSPTELSILEAAPQKPLFCLQMLSRILTRCGIEDSALIQLQTNLIMLEDIIGGCERIYTTPIPLSYTRHTSRYLMIWLTWLPFALWMSCGWAIVVILPLFAALLVGIEEIGVQIEEPFGILPLEVLCDKLKRNLSEISKMDKDCRRLLDEQDSIVEHLNGNPNE